MCTQPQVHTCFKDQILTKTVLNIIFLHTMVPQNLWFNFMTQLDLSH